MLQEAVVIKILLIRKYCIAYDWWDSNPQPLPPEGNTLSVALQPRHAGCSVVPRRPHRLGSTNLRDRVFCGSLLSERNEKQWNCRFWTIKKLLRIIGVLPIVSINSIYILIHLANFLDIFDDAWQKWDWTHALLDCGFNTAPQNTRPFRHRQCQ